MSEHRACLKEGRVRRFWMSPEDRMSLCNMLDDWPEPKGCYVRVQVGDPAGPDLILTCVGHCNTHDPNSVPPNEDCCLSCRSEGDQMIVECSCPR